MICDSACEVRKVDFHKYHYLLLRIFEKLPFLEKKFLLNPFNMSRESSKSKYFNR
ncbi:hypothetical protein LguiA_011762 [Lonicera macranthoides]